MRPERYFIVFVAFFYIVTLFITLQSGVTQRKSLTTIGLPYHEFGDGLYYMLLTRSIAEDGRLYLFEDVNEFTDWLKIVGWHKTTGASMGTAGRIYSVFPPGFSFFAVPFYMIGGIPLVYISNAILAILTIYYIYKLCSLYVKTENAVKTSIIFAFGTAILTYSQALYSETISGLLIAATTFHLIRGIKEKTLGDIILAGLPAGVLPLVKPTLGILTIIYIGFLAINKEKKMMLLFTIALIPFTIIFMAYNHVAFGNPFTTGYSNHIYIEDEIPIVRDIISGEKFWSNNFLKHFSGGLLLIILTQPALIIAYIGIIHNWKNKYVKFITITTMIFLASYSLRIDPLGLWAWSHRFFTPMIPLLSIPFALALEKKQVSENILGILVLISVILAIMSLDTGSWHLFTQFPLVTWINN